MYFNHNKPKPKIYQKKPEEEGSKLRTPAELIFVNELMAIKNIAGKSNVTLFIVEKIEFIEEDLNQENINALEVNFLDLLKYLKAFSFPFSRIIKLNYVYQEYKTENNSSYQLKMN